MDALSIEMFDLFQRTGCRHPAEEILGPTRLGGNTMRRRYCSRSNALTNTCYRVVYCVFDSVFSYEHRGLFEKRKTRAAGIPREHWRTYAELKLLGAARWTNGASRAPHER